MSSVFRFCCFKSFTAAVKSLRNQSIARPATGLSASGTAQGRRSTSSRPARPHGRWASVLRPRRLVREPHRGAGRRRRPTARPLGELCQFRAASSPAAFFPAGPHRGAASSPTWYSHCLSNSATLCQRGSLSPVCFPAEQSCGLDELPCRLGSRPGTSASGSLGQGGLPPVSRRCRPWPVGQTTPRRSVAAFPAGDGRLRPAASAASSSPVSTSRLLRLMR